MAGQSVFMMEVSKGGQGGTPLPTTSLQTKSESVIVGYTHVKQSESAKKPLNTVFQEICRHEMLGDFSADKYLNLENLQKSS